jgi:hypothetical protein
MRPGGAPIAASAATGTARRPAGRSRGRRQGVRCGRPRGAYGVRSAVVTERDAPRSAGTGRCDARSQRAALGARHRAGGRPCRRLGARGAGGPGRSKAQHRLHRQGGDHRHPVRRRRRRAVRLAPAAAGALRQRACPRLRPQRRRRRPRARGPPDLRPDGRAAGLRAQVAPILDSACGSWGRAGGPGSAPRAGSSWSPAAATTSTATGRRWCAAPSRRRSPRSARAPGRGRPAVGLMGRVLERATGAAARAAGRLISRSAAQYERRNNRWLIDVEVEYLAGALCLAPLGLVAAICVAAIYGPVTPLNWGLVAGCTAFSALFLTGLGWVTGINRAGAAPPPPSGSPPVSRRASVGVGCTGGSRSVPSTSPAPCSPPPCSAATTPPSPAASPRPGCRSPAARRSWSAPAGPGASGAVLACASSGGRIRRSPS